MSRSTVLNVMGSASAADAARAAVVSNNKSNANTPGYSSESQRAPR